MKISLVPDAKKAWRWSSVKFAALCAAILSALVDNVSWLVSIISFIRRDQLQHIVAAILFLAAFGLPLFFRITHIKWRHDDAEETNSEG